MDRHALAVWRRLERDLRGYLPPRRYAQFLRAWLVGNVLVGPARRARVRRRRGFEPPRNVNVSMTHKCNLRCRGCYAGAYARGRDMDAEQLERVIREATSVGAYLVGLLGGEPFLVESMFPVLARHRDVSFRISTNGTRIGDRAIDFLRDNGHVVTFLSLEGRADHTDDWRGDGVYATIEQTMDRLRRERLLFGFAATMHRDNRDEITSAPFLARMRELGCRFAVYFTYGPAGTHPDYDLLVDADEQDAAIRRLEAHADALGLVVKVEGRRSPAGSAWAGVNGAGCEAGRCVHVTPQGDVEPCNAIQFRAGNVLEQSLEDVLAHPFHAHVRSAAAALGGPCLAIRHPDRLREIVERHAPAPSHAVAAARLDAYVRDRARRTRGAKEAR